MLDYKFLSHSATVIGLKDTLLAIDLRFKGGGAVSLLAEWLSGAPCPRVRQKALLSVGRCRLHKITFLCSLNSKKS